MPLAGVTEHVGADEAGRRDSRNRRSVTRFPRSAESTPRVDGAGKNQQDLRIERRATGGIPNLYPELIDALLASAHARATSRRRAASASGSPVGTRVSRGASIDSSICLAVADVAPVSPNITTGKEGRGARPRHRPAPRGLPRERKRARQRSRPSARRRRTTFRRWRMV
jgi:hypothetical protein